MYYTRKTSECFEEKFILSSVLSWRSKCIPCQNNVQYLLVVFHGSIWTRFFTWHEGICPRLESLCKDFCASTCADVFSSTWLRIMKNWKYPKHPKTGESLSSLSFCIMSMHFVEISVEFHGRIEKMKKAVLRGKNRMLTYINTPITNNLQPSKKYLLLDI